MEEEKVLDLDKAEAREKFDDPEEFTEAVVQQHIDDLEDVGVEVSPNKEEDLFDVVRDCVKDDIWE